jgi:hypothetical protein
MTGIETDLALANDLLPDRVLGILSLFKCYWTSVRRYAKYWL